MAVKQQKLGDLAEIFLGRPLSRYVLERTNESTKGGSADAPNKNDATTQRTSRRKVEAARARALVIPALVTLPDSLPALEEHELNIYGLSCLAQPGDVVIAMSSPFPSAYINNACVEDMPLFVPNSCAIIRTGELLDAQYLAGYLKIDAVLTQILPALSSGGVAKMLNIPQLSNLRVPLPPLERQAALADVIREHDASARARRRVDALEESLISAAFANIMNEE